MHLHIHCKTRISWFIKTKKQRNKKLVKKQKTIMKQSFLCKKAERQEINNWKFKSCNHVIFFLE